MDALEAQTILGHLKDHNRARRWLGLGARPDELFATFTKIGELSDWSREFHRLGGQFETAASQIDDREVKVATYLAAALYYHIGCLGVFEDSDHRISGYRAHVNAYNEARELFRIPAERVEYTYESTTFSAYFRQAPGVTVAPCVVLLRGLDASREIELHTISTFLLERGLSTFAIDAAGQGESRFAGFKLAPDVSPSVGAALDYLDRRPEVDPNRFAILGQSFGGYLAVSTASREPRFKACVSMGGFFGLADFERTAMAKNNAMMNLKVSAEEYEQVRREFTLEGVIDNMVCPFFAVNGAEDAVIPPSQTVKMYDHARGPKDLKIYDGAPHCAYYDNNTVLFDVADWLVAKLGGGGK